jgi:predicted tellurium resistance membrane protein TerC
MIEFVFILLVCLGLGYVVFSPFIYTLTKCEGAKKFIGLKYSLLNFVVFIGSALVVRPFTDLLSAIGGDTGKTLKSGLNIIWVVFCLYISLSVVMRRMKKALRKPNEGKSWWF